MSAVAIPTWNSVRAVDRGSIVKIAKRLLCGAIGVIQYQWSFNVFWLQCAHRMTIVDTCRTVGTGSWSGTLLSSPSGSSSSGFIITHSLGGCPQSIKLFTWDGNPITIAELTDLQKLVFIVSLQTRIAMVEFFFHFDCLSDRFHWWTQTRKIRMMCSRFLSVLDSLFSDNVLQGPELVHSFFFQISQIQMFMHHADGLVGSGQQYPLFSSSPHRFISLRLWLSYQNKKSVITSNIKNKSWLCW